MSAKSAASSSKARAEKGTSVPWFPPASGVSVSEVHATTVGAYSITRWADAEPMLQVLSSFLPTVGVSLESARIVDGTANNGGDTIAFGLAASMGAVVAVESDPKEYAQLCKNLEAYKSKGHLASVFPVCDDILSVWPHLAHGTDLLLLDPPWGGPEYKHAASIDRLFLNTATGPVDIMDALQQTFTASPTTSPKAVLLKVPKQFDETRAVVVEAATRVFVVDGPKMKWILMGIRV